MPADTGVWVVKMVPGPDRLDGGGRVQALLLNQAANPLQAEEPGVALVDVEHLGLDPEGVQGADPADAEQDLLAQAVLAAAAVQAVGDRPLGRAVLVYVGVEQQQRRPARPRPARSGRGARRRAVAPRPAAARRRCPGRARRGAPGG